MTKEVSPQSYDSVENYFKIAFSYASVKLGLLLVRNPIRVIQTNKLAYPDLTNIQIISHIYAESGVKGFGRGMTTSIAKNLATESYRGILTIKVPKAIRSHLPQSLINSHPASAAAITSLAATGIISIFDTAVICPFFRMSTLQMTMDKNNTLTTIYKTYIKTNSVKKLFQGYTPLLGQTSVLWGVFFITGDMSKFLLNKDFKQISASQAALAAILGAGFGTLINSIFDVTRVQMQRLGNSNLNTRSTLKNLVKNHGVRSLFSGAPHRFAGNIVSYGYRNILNYYLNESDFSSKDSPR